MKSIYCLVTALFFFSSFCFSQEKPLFVITVNDKQGYIDSTGKTVIQPQFDDPEYAVSGDFSEGLAAVKIKGKWGYIDTAGKVVIKPVYLMAGEFKEGLARVEVAGPDPEYGLLGYIDKTGRVVIKPRFKNVRLKMPNWGQFSEGLAPVEVDEKMGFIDRNGKMVIKPKFDWALPFENGLAGVEIDKMYGAIDKSGRVIVPLIYEKSLSFSEGVAQVTLNGKYFFIDTSGKKVIQPPNDNGYDSFTFGFSEGLVSWRFENGKWGFLNKNGEAAIPGIFDFAWMFSEGLAAVEIENKWGYIDRTGIMVIEPRDFKSVDEFSNGLAKVKTEDGKGYINKQGDIVWKSYPDVWFDEIDDPNKPDWEVLPQEARDGEVILSKRNELGILSNFAATPFELYGKRYASVEGFWQMMLYPEGPDDEQAKDKRPPNNVVWKYTREQVAQMTAFEAKSAGTLAEENMKTLGIDWVTFEGKRFPYRSATPGEHYKLILAAMRAKANQNPEVKRILLATGDLTLKPDHHSEPDSPPEWKYYDLWMQIRKELATDIHR